MFAHYRYDTIINNFYYIYSLFGNLLILFIIIIVQCGVPCGECGIILEDILLSCGKNVFLLFMKILAVQCIKYLDIINLGHIYPNPKCYQVQDPKSIVCNVKVTRTLPTCGHEQK